MFEQYVRKHYGSTGAVLLLLVLFGEQTFSIRQQSLSWDEGDHIFAGYMSWKKVDFGINPEHPPLVKALAAIPLLPMRLKVPDPKGLASFKDEAYFDGRDFTSVMEERAKRTASFFAPGWRRQPSVFCWDYSSFWQRERCSAMVQRCSHWRWWFLSQT